MEAEIDQIIGAVIIGLSRPTATTLRLQCMNFALLRDHGVASLELLFSGARDIRIVCAGNLIDARIVEVARSQGFSGFEIKLTHGFLSVTCRELRVTQIAIG
ncbi:hypothetical protein [Bradyrhizobium prioriisuperbiae]|uniref:hypothetical protein n=1 Tax=Bradyrhizobium prioriisuperbiae TaxID=2854389 RepID=UPI0028F067E2|nr:hypothetical protein [Bradyrhizobium prioritasuperba]